MDHARQAAGPAGVAGGRARTVCATERAPINRVQPEALEKSFFVGASLNDSSDDPRAEPSAPQQQPAQPGWAGRQGQTWSHDTNHEGGARNEPEIAVRDDAAEARRSNQSRSGIGGSRRVAIEEPRQRAQGRDHQLLAAGQRGASSAAK